MSRLFISHSSRDNRIALSVKEWLVENGWNDVFLDIHSSDGIAPGQIWKQELQRAAHRCQAVLALVSGDWLASPWCRAEVNAARLMGKKILVALIGADESQVPPDLAEEQWVNLKDDPQGYARLKEGLNRAGLNPSAFSFEVGRRPYPGLSHLEERDAAVYFGRDAEIVRGLDKMRSLARNGVERMLIVLGASGAGKSSFIRAGLWPRLQRDETLWLPIPIVRPERAVISGKFGLAQALQAVVAKLSAADFFRSAGFPISQADITQWLATEEDGLSRFLDALSKVAGSFSEDGRGPTVVLGIDQGEELFQDQGRQEAARFMQLLTCALQTPKVLTVIAVRSDALPLVHADPELARINKDTFALDPMLEGSYRAVIEGPAEVVSLRIDPLLTHALLEDAAGQDALPLLAFALERLYEGYAAEGELTLAHYERLGRIKGIIDKAVAYAFDQGVATGRLPKDKKAQMALTCTAFIPHLAQLNSAGEFIRRVASTEEIPSSALPLIDQLVEQRLLLKDRRQVGSEDQDVVEVAHEALFREWQDLADALQEEKSFLIWLSRVAADEQQYIQLPISQCGSALLKGFALTQAIEWRNKKAGQIPKDVQQFIDTSERIEFDEKRHNRFVEAFTRSVVPTAMGLGTVAALGLIVYVAWVYISAIYNLNSSTNICFQNENQALRAALSAVVKHQIELNDPKLVMLAEWNPGTGIHHHCYNVRPEQ